MLDIISVFELLYLSYGRLAQLARAPRLHRGGRGFEPLSAHQIKIPTFTVGFLICMHSEDSNSRPAGVGGESYKSAVRKAMSQINCVYLTDSRGRQR